MIHVPIPGTARPSSQPSPAQPIHARAHTLPRCERRLQTKRFLGHDSLQPRVTHIARSHGIEIVWGYQFVRRAHHAWRLPRPNYELPVIWSTFSIVLTYVPTVQRSLMLMWEKDRNNVLEFFFPLHLLFLE